MCEDNGEIQLLSLAMLSLSAVFADVLPGYKIKVLKDKSTTLLSKEVQKLRDYEALLLKSYQVGAYFPKRIKSNSFSPLYQLYSRIL